eukprot:TRINITY_DN623_c0_g2_i1.p1 TRINITY_DN623_c0_g2~~TRINITY_DN623_c0_g2_i1.p1  ORF type:complete len:247 (+),score=26.93 TRINITY_DN623_c0_g2_i1:153-893(+)
MLPAFITRISLMLLGYAYPAYDCFKAVERNRPDTEQLRFWCQYWIIMAAVTVAERILDVTVSWLPFYPEAKIAFVVYLWYPQTKGASYIFGTFVHPLVKKHEPEIDRHLKEFKTRAGDMAVVYGQRACKYASERFVDVLHYVATQTHPARSTEPETGGTHSRSMSQPGSKVKRPVSTEQRHARTSSVGAPRGGKSIPQAVSDDDDYINVMDEMPTRESEDAKAYDRHFFSAKKDVPRSRSKNARAQ